MSLRPLHAYRTLLRSAKLAFESDVPVLTAAMQESRKGFETNRSAPPETAETLVASAFDIAEVLRKNVVQGRKEGDTYKLRIHEEIERGDNETVKLNRGKRVLPGQQGKCCSQP